MDSIKDAGDISGKKILVRVDFNVPVENGVVVDAYRIEKSLETIYFLRDYGAKVILVSHRGGSDVPTLAPVAEYLQQYFPVTFVHDVADGEARRAVDALSGGDVVLLENLRQHPGEEKNDSTFAQSLASFADIYVNEGFSASHREHASIVGVPNYLPSYMGFQFALEVVTLSKVLTPTHPFLFILGGAKFATKLPLIAKYLVSADAVFLGGATVNNFYKERGTPIGKSLYDQGDFGIKEMLMNPKLILPETVVVENREGAQTTKKVSEINTDDVIVDIAPEALDILSQKIKDASLIVWNGPLGRTGNEQGSKYLIELMRSAKGTTIIGGGDTATVLNSVSGAPEFSFVSTGGGATLDFLAQGTLPGIEALKKAVR